MVINNHLPGWVDGWMDGWMDGWIGVKAVLRIASNKKLSRRKSNY